MTREKEQSVQGSGEAVGAYLRALREATGKTVAEIADSVGIDPSQIWRIERGKSDPKSSTMFKFVYLVGGDVYDLALLINNPDATRSDGENLARLRRSKGK
jgi:transcriptional regulator with XRE-family HTH domain